MEMLMANQVRTSETRLFCFTETSLVRIVGLFGGIVLFFIGEISAQDVNKQELEALLYSKSSQIVTGSGVSSFGNYAALSSANESIKLGLSRVGQTGDVFNVNVSGGASEGVLTLFNGNKINSNLGFGFTYHKLLIGKNTKIGRDAIERENLEKQKKDVEREYRTKLARVANLVELTTLRDSRSKLEDELENMCSNYGDVKCPDGIKESLSDEEIEEIIKHSRICSKKQELGDLDAKIAEIEHNVEDYLNAQNYLLLVEKNTKLREIEGKVERMNATRVNMSWISAGYAFNRNNFNLFDETKILSEQIIKTSFNREEFFVAFSHFCSEPFESQRYISIGIKYSISNNLEELDREELQDIIPLDSTYVRSFIRKKTVYKGEYKDYISRFNVFFDAYYFLNNKRSLNPAIHVNPELVKIGDSSPVTSFKLGLYLPVKDSNKAGTVVNIEVFMKLNNLFQRPPGVESIISNNSFGIQTSFPFGTIITN